MTRQHVWLCLFTVNHLTHGYWSDFECEQELILFCLVSFDWHCV
jgi:hypothetical protein